MRCTLKLSRTSHAEERRSVASGRVLREAPLSQLRILGDVVLKQTFAFVHGSYRDAVCVLAGSDPLPGSIDLGAGEIASLGLKNRGSGEDHCDYFFPFVGTDDRHSRNMVGIFLQKAH